MSLADTSSEFVSTMINDTNYCLFLFEKDILLHEKVVFTHKTTE